MYSNSYCSYKFALKQEKIDQSSHKEYSNNILKYLEFTAIINACTKKVWKLIDNKLNLNIHVKHSPILQYTQWSCDKLLLHKCDTNIIDIKHKRLNSQQFRSSSPLLQWRRPSHRRFNRIHWPLLHRYHPRGQVFDAENIIS